MTTFYLFLLLVTGVIAVVALLYCAECFRLHLAAKASRECGDEAAELYVGMHESAGFPDLRDSYSPDGDDS